jgi:hypothetical protein
LGAHDSGAAILSALRDNQPFSLIKAKTFILP